MKAEIVLEAVNADAFHWKNLRRWERKQEQRSKKLKKEEEIRDVMTRKDLGFNPFKQLVDTSK